MIPSPPVRHGSHLKMKVHKVGLKFVQRSAELQSLQNNLGFSLYTTPSVYYRIITLEDDQSSKE